jgi:hypothetical protein
MKALFLMVLSLLLGGCSATMVSYSAGSAGKDCPPVVSVKSLGNSVVITDGSVCKKEAFK